MKVGWICITEGKEITCKETQKSENEQISRGTFHFQDSSYWRFWHKTSLCYRYGCIRFFREGFVARASLALLPNRKHGRVEKKVCNLLDIKLTIHDTSKEDNKWIEFVLAGPMSHWRTVSKTGLPSQRWPRFACRLRAATLLNVFQYNQFVIESESVSTEILGCSIKVPGSAQYLSLSVPNFAFIRLTTKPH